MDKKLPLEKTQLSKRNFTSTVDTSFSFFVEPPVEEQPTVESFFELYEDLYFQIPTEGDTNSHRYLVEQSSQFLDVEKDLTQIQPLLDEIAQLRQQVLDLQRENIDLSTQLAQNA